MVALIHEHNECLFNISWRSIQFSLICRDCHPQSYAVSMANRNNTHILLKTVVSTIKMCLINTRRLEKI